MSIENILEKILSHANEEAEKTLEQAREKADQIRKEAQETGNRILDEAEKKGKEEAELLKSRRTSVAELEVRKMRLGAKQEAISKAFDLALSRISQLEKQEYVPFLVKALKETGVDEAELLMNKRDRDGVGQKVLDAVNDPEKPVRLTLSKDTIQAKGGFVLRRGLVEINSTLETLIDGVKEEVTPEVVEALFGE
ncbi:MAG: V-type ATP synthase subunit E [Eubacteriales bacterium]|nr:V-type ATP synthase subunit E [Eubacteriales bacterium]MDD4582848.1 V-type ATP synthase subunit E [Eubacteriales bacterium]